ncbi:MAG TPA: efflux RND transporter periplasmic adaptor subunit [Bdellovibrionales bacterium]|nr:efflux RND transporter periplasmic adaptor subunit [Bdellovibrionales bacterium]
MKVYGGFALILAVLAAAVVFLTQSGSDVSYREVKVERGDIKQVILTTGTVAPENKVEIKPPVSGRVEEVLVKEGQKVKKGQVLAWMSSTERAALLDAARAEGPEEVKRWEEDYKATPVIAPIDGTIILRAVESGQSFANSDPVFTMSDRLTVKAQVDETDIGAVRVGQDAVIVLDAYADKEIPANVDHIAFDAKVNSNVTTYMVDVLPKISPDYMRSGMTANVTFLVAVKQGVMLLPTAALQIGGNQMHVRVWDPEDKGETIDKIVSTGISNGKSIEILDGLAEGEVVLIPESRKQEKNKGTNPLNPFGGRRR